MNIRFERASFHDINDLIEVQNKAFYSDYMKYGECPGYNKTPKDMELSIEKGIVFKILVDNVIVGRIRVKDKENGNYFLSALCVIPEYENNGIGQKAMAYIESYFSNAKHWSLETPADKRRNHYFYKKCGFEITKEYMDGNVKIALFEKNMNAKSSGEMG